MPRGRAWSDQRFTGTSLVAGNDILSNLLEFGLEGVDNLTVVRIIGELNVHYVVTTTIADSDSFVDVGIGVTSAQAFGVGAGSVPDPANSASFPPRGWLYAATGYVAQLITTDTGIVNINTTFKFDIRAMRKIDKGTLFMRLAQANINVGGAMEVVGRVRTLVLT